MPDVFGPELAGWHRTGVQDLPATQPPDAIPVKLIQQIRTATYEGPGKLEARAYALSSSAVALDLVQRWEARPDTVFFYSDRFLVVVHWQTAEKKAMQPFLFALEKAFAPKK
jgi:hypothetical protein